MEEHRNKHYYDERRQCRTQARTYSPFSLSQFVAYEDTDINSEDPRTRLSHSNKVGKHILIDPFVFLYYFSVNKRNHGISSAESERPDFEESSEEPPQVPL